MSDLFKKLNTLVKSSINDIVRPASTERRRGAPRSGIDLDREVRILRDRINEAVGYEDTLKARLIKHQQDFERWDVAADDAVMREDNHAARYAVEQMKQAEQRRLQAERDLQAHEAATRDLISRVNLLESVVAEARHSQGEKPETAHQGPMRRIEDVLRETRERVSAMGDLLAAQDEVQTAQTGVTTPDEAVVEDDLARRRQRLSK